MNLGKMAIVMAFLLLEPVHARAVSPSDLVLLGQGEVRYLGFITVYEASLYGDGAISVDAFFSTPSSRCLKLNYKVSLSVDNFIEAAELVLQKQRNAQELASARPAIDLLHNNYRDVQSGDSYELCFDADTQETTLNLNGEDLVTIESVLFADIYFGIWLDKTAPLSTTLREKLISGLRTEEDSR